MNINFKYISNKTYKLLFILALFFAFSSSASAVTFVKFIGLGDLPGGKTWSTASGVSYDGSIIVGSSHSSNGLEAFIWKNGEMRTLGTLAEGMISSYASNVSSNGKVVVGYTKSADGQKAFFWKNNAMLSIGDYIKNKASGSATNVSADGSVVIGWHRIKRGRRAFRYSGGEFEKIPYSPHTYFRGNPVDISADGTVILGIHVVPRKGRRIGITVLLEGTSIKELADLPGGRISNSAQDMSSDGLFIVGHSDSHNGQEAYLWKNNTIIGLGDLPGGRFNSSARGVSDDGKVVVGKATTSEGQKAFIWTEDSPKTMRSISSLLKRDGFDLNTLGWKYLLTAKAVSGDGKTIIGVGARKNGDFEGWMAVLKDTAQNN